MVYAGVARILSELIPYPSTLLGGTILTRENIIGPLLLQHPQHWRCQISQPIRNPLAYLNVARQAWNSNQNFPAPRDRNGFPDVCLSILRSTTRVLRVLLALSLTQLYRTEGKDNAEGDHEHRLCVYKGHT
jgi:hypothetical protein